jgi:hypothetical protein
MKALLASSPVTSQVLNVKRHSLACGDFRLNAPFVTSSMKPRSWSSAKPRWAVPRAILHRSEALRTDSPIWPLFLLKQCSVGTVSYGQVNVAHDRASLWRAFVG